jgi:hypothetical protein
MIDPPGGGRYFWAALKGEAILISGDRFLRAEDGRYKVVCRGVPGYAQQEVLVPLEVLRNSKQEAERDIALRALSDLGEVCPPPGV